MTDQPTEIAPQPHPLPASWVVTAAAPPHKFVIIFVNDAAGQRVLFLEPDAAIDIARELNTAARQARSGLHVPGASPGLNGHGRPS